VTEDDLLAGIAVEQALNRLADPEARAVLSLVFGIACPPDWDQGPARRWPPPYSAIGRYIGKKFRNGPITEAAVRYIRDRALSELRGEERPKSARNGRKSRPKPTYPQKIGEDTDDRG
jgi:hypothetical protein